MYQPAPIVSLLACAAHAKDAHVVQVMVQKPLEKSSASQEAVGKVLVVYLVFIFRVHI